MFARPVILCAMEDLSRAAVEQRLLVRAGFAVTYSGSADDAAVVLASRHIDLVVMGTLPATEQKVLLGAARDHGVPVVLVDAIAGTNGNGHIYVADQSKLVPCIRQVLSAAKAA